MSLNSSALASCFRHHTFNTALVLVAPVYTLDIDNQYMNFRRSLLDRKLFGPVDMGGAQHSFEMGKALR